MQPQPLFRVATDSGFLTGGQLTDQAVNICLAITSIGYVHTSNIAMYLSVFFAPGFHTHHVWTTLDGKCSRTAKRRRLPSEERHIYTVLACVLIDHDRDDPVAVKRVDDALGCIRTLYDFNPSRFPMNIEQVFDQLIGLLRDDIGYRIALPRCPRARDLPVPKVAADNQTTFSVSDCFIEFVNSGSMRDHPLVERASRQHRNSRQFCSNRAEMSVHFAHGTFTPAQCGVWIGVFKIIQGDIHPDMQQVMDENCENTSQALCRSMWEESEYHREQFRDRFFDDLLKVRFGVRTHAHGPCYRLRRCKIKRSKGKGPGTRVKSLPYKMRSRYTLQSLATGWYTSMLKHRTNLLLLLVSTAILLSFATLAHAQSNQWQPSQNQNPFNSQDTLRLDTRPTPSPAQGWLQPSPNSDEQARVRQLRNLHNTARQFEFMGQNDRALDMYYRILDLYPTDKQAFDGIRRNLQALGRHTEVEVMIRERLRDPESWDERANLLAELGGALYESNRLAAADSAWAQAFAVEPVSEVNFREVANVQISVRLLDRAIQTYKDARETLNNPSAFSINLANLYTSQMNWSSAAGEYLRVLRDNSRRVHYVRRGLANFPNQPAANDAVTKAIEAELNETRRHEPWNGHRIQLNELLIDQRTKNGDYAGALEAVANLDALEHADGDRLLGFASETLEEGFESVASDALDLAAERMNDPEGVDVINLMRGQVAGSHQDYMIADSLFTVVVDDPASVRVERSALMSRGLIRLQQLDQPHESVQDFRTVRELGWPDRDRRLDYYEALGLVRIDSLDAALIPLLRNIPIEQDPVRSYGFETQKGVIGNADLVHLAARIMLWLGNRETSSALLDSVLTPPVGAPAENETLLLLHLITTTQDTSALSRYAEADRARFTGQDSLALSLMDSLASDENIPEQLSVEAAYSAAFLKLELQQSSLPIAEFANIYGLHPRVEEAWYRLGQWWEASGNSEEAAIAYEMVLLNHPDGLMQALARLRLEELTFQQFLPVPVEEDS